MCPIQDSDRQPIGAQEMLSQLSHTGQGCDLVFIEALVQARLPKGTGSHSQDMAYKLYSEFEKDRKLSVKDDYFELRRHPKSCLTHFTYWMTTHRQRPDGWRKFIHNPQIFNTCYPSNLLQINKCIISVGT